MSKNTVRGIVIDVQTTGHTVYGNPIKWVTVDESYVSTSIGSTATHRPLGYHFTRYRISDNASLAFEIGNPEFRDEPNTFALTRAGRISHRVR